VGSTILGDLSYRTAGSQFRQSGMFEVTKADDAADATAAGGAAGGSPGAAGGTAPTAAGPTKPRSALKVTVPSELEGIAYIQVTIQRDNEQLVSATLGQFSGVPQKGAELHWQNKLEAGQFYLHPLLYWRRTEDRIGIHCMRSRIQAFP
jgi:mediator of RNA polymerase II transcription subunit 17